MGSVNLNHVSPTFWRKQCGAVMQEGYIFNDTIADNIAVGVDKIDKKKLKQAASMACIQSFIEELPLQYNTKIGMEGVGLSSGQKQRILIARAIYKNPQLLFFDEATSALDANNETAIMKNVDEFLTGRTSVVIAHRLSTVKNADQIVVLDKGTIAEVGTHQSLLDKRGIYFNLVKNQLDLERMEMN
jgi:ATP-binding cassette subfamily B protein